MKTLLVVLLCGLLLVGCAASNPDTATAPSDTTQTKNQKHDQDLTIWLLVIFGVCVLGVYHGK